MGNQRGIMGGADRYAGSNRGPTEETMLVLETKNLTKQYKRRTVVDGVNMHVEEGDIYGFVGENGAGKTTIIRMISGLAAPTRGSYSLFGVDARAAGIAQARAKTGGIVETVSLSPSLTAGENVDFQCKLTGKTLTDDEKDALLRRVGLVPEEIAKKKAGSFSLGMRQRLGIALTLVSEPRFIVLDEPMNGLDPKGFIEVRDVITALNREGITFLISSHILSELDKICTRIGFLSHGVLLKELSIAELHDASKAKIVVEAEDVEGARLALTGALSLTDVRVEGNTLHIFDAVDINDVIRVLVEQNLRVRNVGKREDTIETYYMNLIGGVNRA